MTRLLRYVAVVAVTGCILGCGKEQPQGRSGWVDPEKFTPVGVWSLDENQFTFHDGGTFSREILGENPHGFWWEGEWEREGRKIHAKVTDGKTDIGEATEFVITDEDVMRIPGWGDFVRHKVTPPATE